MCEKVDDIISFSKLSLQADEAFETYKSKNMSSSHREGETLKYTSPVCQINSPSHINKNSVGRKNIPQIFSRTSAMYKK